MDLFRFVEVLQEMDIEQKWDLVGFDRNRVKQALKEAGFDFDEEEFRQWYGLIAASLREEEDLSEDELNLVTGGCA